MTNSIQPRRVRGEWGTTILPQAAEIVESYSTRVTLRQLLATSSRRENV